jgi:putative DNA primase/helicase
MKTSSIVSVSDNFVQDLSDLLDLHLGRSQKYTTQNKRWICSCCNSSAVRLQEKSAPRSEAGTITCFGCNAGAKDLFKRVGSHAWQDYLKVYLPSIGKTYQDKNSYSASTSRDPKRKAKKQNLEKEDVRLSPVFPPEFIPLRLGVVNLPVEEEFFWPKQNAHYLKTTYLYSDTQKIIRFDPLEDGPDLKKVFAYYHLEQDDDFPSEPRWEKEVGPNPFPFYNLPSALKEIEEGNPGNYILMAEGEKCADWVQTAFKIACVSPDGRGWQEDLLRNSAKLLRANGLACLYLADNDNPGKVKAEKWQQACEQEGVFCQVIHIGSLFPFLQEGQDIADVLKLVVQNNFNISTLKEINIMDNQTAKDYQQKMNEMYQAFFAPQMEAMLLSPQQIEIKKTELDNTYQDKEASRADGRHPEVKPSAIEIAQELVADEGPFIRWVTDRPKYWMFYDALQGLWKEVSEEDVLARIRDRMKEEGFGRFSMRFLKDAVDFLRVELRGPEVKPLPHLIPFLNGVLNKITGEFKPHSPSHQLTWTLPYEYSPTEGQSRYELAQKCAPILNWLLEAMGGTEKDRPLVDLLCCYLAAVIRGRTDYQRYLECIGRAGSGKGTFLRLATALVGSQNTAATTLKLMESNRFEASKLCNATLAIVTDAQDHIGDPEFLKGFVGQDLMPGEQKFKQERAGDGMAARGMLILAGERMPSASDSGGMRRRRITIPFNWAPKNSFEVKDLISIRPDGSIQGDFAPYLGHFFAYLLSYSSSEIDCYVRHTDFYVPRLAQLKATSILDTNNLALWANERLYWSDRVDLNTGLNETYTPIGLVETDRDGISNAHLSLYANYVQWTRASGIRNVMSVGGFRKGLEELFNIQLEMPISIRRPSGKGNHVYGLAIRDTLTADSPYIIDEIYAQRLIDKATNLNSIKPAHLLSQKGSLERGSLAHSFSGENSFQETIFPDLNPLFASLKENLFEQKEVSQDGFFGVEISKTPGGVDCEAMQGFFKKLDKSDEQEEEQVEADERSEFGEKSFKKPSKTSQSTQSTVSAVQTSNQIPNQEEIEYWTEELAQQVNGTLYTEEDSSYETWALNSLFPGSGVELFDDMIE